MRSKRHKKEDRKQEKGTVLDKNIFMQSLTQWKIDLFLNKTQF